MFNSIVLVVNFFGYLSAVLFMVMFIRGVYLWSKGILPVFLRLGRGLVESKIAIFAKDDNLDFLENLLLESGLFLKTNIIRVSDVNNMYRAEKASLYLVFWHDWQEDIDSILTQRRDRENEKKRKSIPLIVYAPQELGFIPPERMNQLGNQNNTVVTNFRGRLLNDIMISLITGSYGN